MAPLYVYVLDSNVVRAPNTPTSPIIITANNAALSPAIPPKLQNKGLEPFMDYLQSHPLRYALSDIADPFLPAHICEFYYSCTFDPATHSLNGTITGGTEAITITPTTIRNSLRFPVLQAYPEHPTEAK